MPNSQEWDAARYQRDGQFVADYGAVILDWLNPQADEHVLDLGCGEGALTEKIFASGLLRRTSPVANRHPIGTSSAWSVVAASALSETAKTTW